MRNLEERRAEFEAWWEGREEAGTAAKYRAFDAWNAALDAVVIRLPSINGTEYDPLANSDYREECRSAIESCGLKVAQ